MARSLGNMVIHLGLDSRGMVSGAATTQNLLSRLQGQFSAFGSSVTGILAGVAASLASGFGLRKVLELYGEQERQERRLAAIMKSTGNAAGFSAKQLQELASSLQQVTTFGDEVTLPAISILATFKEIKGDVFKDAIEAAMDLSTVMGQDLKSSVVQIGKALNDPITGLTALRRVGVSFTEQQREQIKALTESGRVMEAQKIILAELSAEFGGAARAEADTFSGSLAQMKNALGDLGEVMGSIIAPAIRKFADMVKLISETMQGLRSSIDTNTVRLTVFATAFLAAMAIGPKLISMIMAIVKAFRALATAQAIQQAFSGVKGWLVLAGSVAAAAAAAHLVGNAFDEQQASLERVSAEAAKLVRNNEEITESFEGVGTATDDASKRLDELKRKGESLTQSLRTPAEQYADAVAEANELWAQGIISQETFGRALEKARDTLLESVSAAKELQQVNTNVGAAERFTSQGFSASQSTRMADLIKRGQDQQLQEAKKHTELLAEANRLAQEKTGVTLKKVTL